MKFIKNCRSCRYGEYGNVKCESCTHSSTNPPSNWEPIPNQTNGDRIRAMSDEELAEWMAECNAFGENAEASQWLPWLKQPAKEEK